MKAFGWLLLAVALAGAGLYMLGKPEPLRLYQTGGQAEPSIDAYATPIAPTAPAELVRSVTEIQPAIELKKSDEQKPLYTPEQALAMMQHSTERGDARQPQLMQREAVEQRASAEQLADAESYAAYEQRQTKAVIASYAAILDQLPLLWEKVNQGANDPRITPAQYREALEALEQLELMRGRLEAEHPELLRAATREPLLSSTSEEGSP